RLWELSGKSRHLTIALYNGNEIGGLGNALSVHADEIMEQLKGEEATVEQVFRALSEVDENGRAIRRALRLSELLAETAIDRNDVCSVIDRFRADDCSFLTPPKSLVPRWKLENDDDQIIDVGHEAMLRRWHRVSGEPGATGQEGDARDIGWLKREREDGERYKMFRSVLEPKRSKDAP